ncbi:MAG TPA: fatty acid desaturase [Bryobacteraceae bacterium]|nr:fatty acid desaturase [Bryobacteraceae bacterium]
MADEARSSTPLALAITALDVALYVVLTVLLISASSAVVSALYGVLLGVVTGFLFTVGHDACHGSFTRNASLNAILGRIAFLPSYTPFTSWAYAHNSVHHRYTNLRTRDYVWAPFTKAEYDRLPWWRRLLERWYRSLTGVGPYYAAEIWWKKLAFPTGSDVPRRRVFQKDRLMVVAFAVAQAITICMFAAHPARALLCGMAIPFLVWNYMMGLVIFQHHTHPRIAWFNDESKWRYTQAQVANTVHIVFPRPINFLLHRIMEHTAHHVDVRIPMYRLERAQALAESVEAAGIVVESWSPRLLFECFRTCRLYDFERNAWLDFDGKTRSAAPATWAARVSETRNQRNGVTA